MPRGARQVAKMTDIYTYTYRDNLQFHKEESFVISYLKHAASPINFLLF